MNNISYAVVIPSNRVFDSIKPLLVSLSEQTLPPSQIVIVRDRHADKSELDTYIISAKLLFAQLEKLRIDIIHPWRDKKFTIWQGASYVRNYGRKQVTTPYMMFIDDDNVCPDDMAENLFGFVTQQAHPEYTVVSPLQYDDTQSTIRPALASGFNFTLCRPVRLWNHVIESSDRYFSLQLASSNCLAGPTPLFEKYPFDEQIPFVYEDLIMTANMSKWWVQLFADSWAHVIHHHAHRNKLSELYANTPDRAYYKAKHRIILINVLWNWRQQLLFYLSWFVWQLGWIVLHILYYAPMSHWFSLFSALYKGTKDGIVYITRRS